MAKKVLVVDDEKLIVKGIRFSLEQDGMEVDCAYDGEEALNMAKANEYDMILLDIMLPKMDGFEVCQAIREFSDMPIVMLTAKGDDMDKILGLDYGADDYITKPFNILEVKARIKAIMRRTAGPREKKEVSSIVEKGDLRLDCDSRRLFISGREVNLTAKEFDLLELLVKNEIKYTAGKICSDWSGEKIIRETCVQWMCMYVVCVKRSKPTQVNRNTCTQNGVWDIIITRNRREGRKVFPCRRVNSFFSS